MLDKVNSHHKLVDGVTVYPQKYGADGWYNFTPQPFNQFAAESRAWPATGTFRGRVWLRGNTNHYAAVGGLRVDLHVEELPDDVDMGEAVQTEWAGAELAGLI